MPYPHGYGYPIWNSALDNNMNNAETHSFQYAFYHTTTSSRGHNPAVFGEKMFGNENGHYKPDSGKFIIPEKGSYYFSTQFQETVNQFLDDHPLMALICHFYF